MDTENIAQAILERVVHELSLHTATQAQPDAIPLGVGSLRVARVTSTDPEYNRVFVELIAKDMISSEQATIYPGFMCTPSGSGLWHGLKRGDTVLVAMSQANRFIFINKINDRASDITDDHYFFDPAQKFAVKEGAFSLRARATSGDAPSSLMSIDCIPDEGISIGMQPYSSMNIDLFPSTQDTNQVNAVMSFQTGQKYSFTQGSYEIDGVVLRISPAAVPEKKSIDVNSQDKWYANLAPICFDPSRPRADTTDENRIKNPAFVERRSIIYEFADGANVESDTYEAQKQDVDSATARTDVFVQRQPASRRSRKNDALSMSLVYPNHLIEKIEGTVVDVFGNALDLNRHKIPVGKDQLGGLEGTADSYKKIRALHRKDGCFHFEINARKNPTDAHIDESTGNEYGKINKNYARDRSRFFFDVDKEGQFKINVPASSETGNVGLLARYENVSTVNAPTESDSGINFDTFVVPDNDKSDVVLDAFGKGCVELKGDEKLIPLDRLTNETIKLGTAFHDISKTCCEYALTGVFKDQGASIFRGPDLFRDAVVHTTVNISGEDANAGGRSGTFVFDGMLNVSIGANTVDRQSLWLDMAGGGVFRFGRDYMGSSFVGQMDGDFFLELGGTAPNDDSRFPDKDWDNSAAIRNTTLEIRVIGKNNRYHRILIDNTGILLRSAGNIQIETPANLILHAGTIISNCEITNKHTQAYNFNIDTSKRQEAQDERQVASEGNAELENGFG